MTLPRHISGYRSRILNAIIERLRIQRPIPGPGILIQETTGGSVISALLHSPDTPYVPVSMRCLNEEDDEQPRNEPPELIYDVYVYGKLPGKNEDDPERLAENRLLKKIDPGAEPHLFRRDSYWPPLSHGHRGDPVKEAKLSRTISVGGEEVREVDLDFSHTHYVEFEYNPPRKKNPTRLWTEPATFGIALRVAEKPTANADDAYLLIVWCNEYIKEIDDKDYDPDEEEEEEDDNDCDQNDHPANGGPGSEKDDPDHSDATEQDRHPGLDDEEDVDDDSDPHPGTKDCYTTQ